MEELDLMADECEIYKKETGMKQIDSRTILISMLSGGSSSLITDIIYFPLDSIKTRLQASSNRVDFVKKTENLSKLKGISAIMMVSLPYSMTFFLVYDNVKRILSEKTSFNNSVIHLLGAAAAETAGGIVRNPFEVVKQQMQVGWNATFLNTTREIYQLSGIKGFYAGFLSLLLREIPFSSIQFPIYEFMKKRTLEKHKTIGFWQSGWNGLVAAVIAAFLTNPIDVVKSRLMTQRDKYYSNTFNCFKSIYYEEGPKGFMKGVHIRVPSVGFTGILFFAIYERSKLVFDKILPKW